MMGPCGRKHLHWMQCNRETMAVQQKLEEKPQLKGYAQGPHILGTGPAHRIYWHKLQVDPREHSRSMQSTDTNFLHQRWPGKQKYPGSSSLKSIKTQKVHVWKIPDSDNLACIFMKIIPKGYFEELGHSICMRRCSKFSKIHLLRVFSGLVFNFDCYSLIYELQIPIGN